MVEDIRNRTFRFALDVVAATGLMKESLTAIVVGKQVLRSGTSIGANIEEATAACSRNDFIHAMNIALKEARETHYWLRLMNSARLVTADLDVLVDESDQITRILGSIVSKARGTSKRQ